MEFYEFMQNLMQLQTRDKLRRYADLNRTAVRGGTVLAGSSLMENFPVNEMLMSRGVMKTVYNRGLGGLTIRDYEPHLDVCILDLAPSRLFINIGSNDLNLPGDTVGNLIEGYRHLLQIVKTRLPACRITLLAYYPCCAGEPAMPPIPNRIPRTIENIRLANERVAALAQELGLKFLDLSDAVAGPDGYLDPAVAMDDIHFSPAGYERVLDRLLPLL